MTAQGGEQRSFQGAAIQVDCQNPANCRLGRAGGGATAHTPTLLIRISGSKPEPKGKEV